MQTRNKILDCLNSNLESLIDSTQSLGRLLEDWKEDNNNLYLLNDQYQEDTERLLSFLSFQDETLATLGKIKGQMLFVLSSDLMEKGRQKAKESKGKPTLVDFKSE